MKYSRIISLIDEDISRLQRAREMLTDVEPVLTAAPAAYIGKAEHEQEEPVQEMAPIFAFPEPVKADSLGFEPRRVKSAGRRSPRTQTKASGTLSPTALNGSVPVGPVFVPGNKGKSEPIEGGKAPGRSEAEQPLSAALLTQRWLQSSTH